MADDFHIRTRPFFPKEPDVSPEPAIPVSEADGPKRTTEPPFIGQSYAGPGRITWEDRVWIRTGNCWTREDTRDDPNPVTFHPRQPGAPAGMMRFNNGKHRMTLIPASFGRYTAAVLEYGAIKYDTNNWRQGGSWTSAIDSLQRHLDAFREGEDFDPESTLPHLAHLAFNVMILIEFFDKNLGQDDRFRYPDQPRGEQIPGRELTFNQPPPRKS